MEKEFVPYEQALEMKEIGFKENCFGGYVELTKTIHQLFLHDAIYKMLTNSNVITHKDLIIYAPTFSQSFKFFRDKFKLYSCVNTFTEELNDDILYFIYEIRNPEQFELSEVYKTYEEAELACLKKLIEIIKSK